MALELFKPFVMHELVARNLASNIKNARRKIDREDDDIWDVVEDVIKERPVLLNRAQRCTGWGSRRSSPS